MENSGGSLYLTYFKQCFIFGPSSMSVRVDPMLVHMLAAR